MRFRITITIAIIVFFIHNGYGSWESRFAGSPNMVHASVSGEGQIILAAFATNGFWQSFDGGHTWNPANELLDPLELPVFIELYSSDVGDTLALIAADSRVRRFFLSGDGGISWNRVNNTSIVNSHRNAVVFEPENPRKIYCFSSCYLSITDNFGEDWDQVVLDTLHVYGKNIAVFDTSENSILVASDFFFDHGSSQVGGLVEVQLPSLAWEQKLPLLTMWNIESASIGDIDILSDGSWIVPVSFVEPDQDEWVHNPILVSEDRGTTWNRVGEGLPARFDPVQILEDPQLAGHLLTIGEQKHGVYESFDYGNSWTRVLNGLPANVSRTRLLTCDRSTGDLYVSVVGWGLYKTEDSGENWDLVPTPQLGSKGYLSVFNNHLFFRDDAFRIWKLSFPHEIWEEIQYPLLPDRITMLRPIAYQNQDTLVSGVWARTRAVVSDTLRMAYSFDAGSSWSYHEPLPRTIDFPIVHQNEERVLFFANDYYSQYINTSTDLGISWQSYPQSNGLYTFIVSDTVIYGANSTTVFKSRNSGEDWESLGWVGTHDGLLGSLDGEVYLSVRNYETRAGDLHVWSDGHWEVRGQLPLVTTNMVIIPTSTDTMFLATPYDGSDIKASWDHGWTWNELNLQLPYPQQTYGFLELQYDPWRDRVWAVTGAGICYLEVGDISGTEETVFFIPGNHTLVEAWPNPFNSATTIRYEVLSVQEIEMNIYNLSGQLVHSIVESPQTPGIHTTQFSGDHLASGIYFLRFRQGAAERTLRLILEK